jgi:hypothetical protein
VSDWPAPVPARYATPRTPGRPLIVNGRAVLSVAKAFGDHRSASWPSPLMPHQRQIFATALQARPDGTPQFREVVVTVPRQSGKSHSMMTLMTLAAIRARARVWYTAQTRNDALDYFLNELAAAFQESSNPFSAVVKQRLTTGMERLQFPGRSQIRLFAPTRKALHGKQADTVVLDEAWSLTEERGKELRQGIMPTGNTRPRFQLWILSTAGTDSSGFLKPLVERLRTEAMDPDGETAYFEWSAEADESAPDDVILQQVTAAHPALGWTTDPGVLAHNLAAMGRAEFLRAYGNMWTSAVDRIIPAAQWKAALVEAPPPQAGPACLAVDVAPDRGQTAIGVAWHRDGRLHAAVAAHDSGTDWAAAETARIARRLRATVVIDEGSAAGTLIEPLRRAGVRVRTIGARDVARACGETYDELMGGRLTLTPDPALDVASAGAVKRTLADSWAWGRRASAADITPLCAITWAAWGMRHPEALPMIV